MIHSRKPLILITNDDGIQAPGIRSLINAVQPLGELVVLAPDGARSGMSSAITSLTPLQLELVEQQNGRTEYACSGTPVDCVKLAMNQVLDRKPDLLISGINHGSNAAISVIYSGTMGAALEGCINGIPSFGVSLTNHSLQADMTQASLYAADIANRIIRNGLPPDICLNVNIPDTNPVKGIRICKQTKGRWIEEFDKAQNTEEKDIYWLTGSFENADPEDPETDEWVLSQGYVSVVPCMVDMTAYKAMDILRSWE